jgi:hypothetical protein
LNPTLQRRAAAATLLALAALGAGCSKDGTCSTSALCAPGDVCLAGRCVSTLPAGSCTPPTNPTPAAGGTVPGTSVPACNPLSPPAPVAPVDTGLQTSLGAADVGDLVSFDVPPGTSSVTIHAQAVTAVPSFNYLGYTIPNSVVPTAVTAPNGDVVYDDNALPPASAWKLPGYYAGVTASTGSFTLPDTWRMADFALADGQLPAGRWTFRVNDWNAECAAIAGCSPGSSGRYDLTLVTRPGPYVSTGTLDVAVYIVGHGAHAASFGAADAVGDPAFGRFVQRIGELLGQAGICLGTVTFFDLDPAVRSALDAVDVCGNPPCDDLSQLFAFASRVHADGVTPFNGVHLFLVDALTASGCGGGTGTIVGIDGSIPGPSGLPGARTSGAAMSIENVSLTGCGGAFDIDNCHADLSGYIAAHEIGHWLGLYHTTEASGDMFDPLSDTPTCECKACGNQLCGASSTAMLASSCTSSGPTCGGGDNLMFWLLQAGVSQGKLSAQQALIMRTNSAVQ